MNPTKIPAWSLLTELSKKVSPIRELVYQNREFLRLRGAGIGADFSRQRIDPSIFEALVQLLKSTDVSGMRDSMFAGQKINTTEDRAVLHTALRRPSESVLKVDGVNVVAEVHSVLHRMQSFAESVRDGSWKGATGQSINRVINIGIGGSDLGPAMAYQALRAYAHPDISFAFVSNVDPEDLLSALSLSDPERTLFIVVSKTFNTAETMANAEVARSWVIDAMDSQPVSEVVKRHFIAVSTNLEAVADFGIEPVNMFEFWDWVGGRYSMESAVGLSTMIAIGPDNYADMLRGSHDMDLHFLTSPIEGNIPMIMGAIAVWNRDFLGIETTAVLPYSHFLSRFPAYLQQLTMESNGKSVRSDGSPVDYQTTAIYWGEPGTNGQHSFYQFLHQGTSVVACDLVVVARNSNGSDSQQSFLVSNALAQASVLSMGITAEELSKFGGDDGIVAHKQIPGNRPVSVFMLNELDPYTLGALVALYEHSVFVQGAIWGINSFDQWGVEWGKKVANGIVASIEEDSDTTGFDPSTQASIAEYLKRSRGG